MISGVFIIDKPAGITSHDVIQKIRHLTGQRQVGHAGTLDPFATGVLLVAIGQATRLLEYTKGLPKTYTAEITLGATSTTDDLTGELTHLSPRQEPTQAELEHTLQQFNGDLQQVPPLYAAIKVQGKKLYEYARAGQPVERKARSIKIYSLSLLSYTYPTATIKVECSGGTYIRALARDIGEALGTGGYLTTLRRNAIGTFTEQTAVKIGEASKEELVSHLQPAQQLVAHLPSITLSEGNVAKFKNGGKLSLNDTIVSPISTGPITILAPDHHLAGIGVIDPISKLLIPQKVFPTV